MSVDDDLLLGAGLFSMLGIEAHDPTETAEAAALLARVRRFGITRERFLEHVAAQLAGDHQGSSPPALLSALRDCHLDDLALAAASVDGDPQALAELERTMIEPVPKAIARLRPDARMVDEVRQALREKLLVPAADGTRPKLLDYKGRGPLGAWVRVVATRVAHDHRRAHADHGYAEDSAAFEKLADDADAPDVVHLKATYGVEVKAAFAEAVSTLSDEQRSVLRAHTVDGLSIDQIGALYQIHRATAARWVQQARGALVDALRLALARRLGVEESACASLVALVRSRIDLSLDAALAEPPSDGS